MPYISKEQQTFFNRCYYIEHRERLKQKRVGSVLCSVCAKSISKINILKHKNTKNHKLLEEKKNIYEILSHKFDDNISSIIASYMF